MIPPICPAPYAPAEGFCVLKNWEIRINPPQMTPIMPKIRDFIEISFICFNESPSQLLQWRVSFIFKYIHEFIPEKFRPVMNKKHQVSRETSYHESSEISHSSTCRLSITISSETLRFITGSSSLKSQCRQYSRSSCCKTSSIGRSGFFCMKSAHGIHGGSCSSCFEDSLNFFQIGLISMILKHHANTKKFSICHDISIMSCSFNFS